MHRLLKASDLRYIRKGESYTDLHIPDKTKVVKFRYFESGRKYGVVVAAADLYGTAEENASSIATSAGTLAQWQVFVICGGTGSAWQSALPRTQC